jgi:hypothetical protein
VHFSHRYRREIEEADAQGGGGWSDVESGDEAAPDRPARPRAAGTGQRSSKRRRVRGGDGEGSGVEAESVESDSEHDSKDPLKDPLSRRGRPREV